MAKTCLLEGVEVDVAAGAGAALDQTGHPALPAMKQRAVGKAVKGPGKCSGRAVGKGVGACPCLPHRAVRPTQ